MPFWSRLFGSSSDTAPAPAEAEEYKGFRITPGPIREGSHYRVAATIEKTVDGETVRHDLIRADTVAALDEAVRISGLKARQVIDEQGERLFAPRNA